MSNLALDYRTIIQYTNFRDTVSSLQQPLFKKEWCFIGKYDNLIAALFVKPRVQWQTAVNTGTKLCPARNKACKSRYNPIRQRYWQDLIGTYWNYVLNLVTGQDKGC
jgi:hypothetical protein